MSIKNDVWIKRMALEHAMIEPFVDGQVRAGVKIPGARVTGLGVSR